MRVRDDCFVKYCRAKKEKLKIYMEYKVLRNEVKMKTKQDKKTFPVFITKKKKKKKDLSKPSFALLPKTERTPCSLKHNGVLLFNPVKIAENFNFFFTNIGPNIAKRIHKRKKSPMTHLNHKILKSFFFYPTIPDEIIKVVKSFFNNKPASPNSLSTPILNNCADVLSFPISYLVNLSYKNGEFPNLCKTAKFIPLLKKGDPLDCSNHRPISLLSTFIKIFEKCVYKRAYCFLGKNNLIFKREFGFR